MRSARQDMPGAVSVAATRQDSLRRSLAQFATAPPALLYLRDGEVVLYRRSHSLLYQCRYKLADGTWQRRTTGKASLEQAVVAACDLYDEARYRQRLGLAHRAQSFAQIAAVCVAQLRQQIDAKGKKTALNDYVSIIERYFVPYFGERQLETLTHADIREFELWREPPVGRLVLGGLWPEAVTHRTSLPRLPGNFAWYFDIFNKAPEVHPFQGVAVLPVALCDSTGEAGCGQRYWIGLSSMRRWA